MKLQTMGYRGLVALLVAVTLFAAVPAAQAGPFRVSQESAAGLGDFDANVLGYIDPFSTPLTGSVFFKYGSPDGASYNGQDNGGPEPVSSLSQIFLVQASDGLHLAVVHDRAGDTGGGTADTRWDLVNDTAGYTARDDNPGNDFYPLSGPNTFTADQQWNACCTDGYMIGTLEGFFIAYGQFTAAPTGINALRATNANGSNISLVLETGRRVRIDAVPEPGTWALMGLGLLGLAAVRRRRRKA